MPGDVGRDLHLVGQPHAGDLAQRRVRLLRRHRAHLQADAALLGGARNRGLALVEAVPDLAHRRSLDLRDLRLPAVAHELADRRHGDAVPFWWSGGRRRLARGGGSAGAPGAVARGTRATTGRSRHASAECTSGPSGECQSPSARRRRSVAAPRRPRPVPPARAPRRLGDVGIGAGAGAVAEERVVRVVVAFARPSSSSASPDDSAAASSAVRRAVSSADAAVGDVVEERVVLGAELLRQLAAGERLGRPAAVGLAAGGDVGRGTRAGRDELADDDVLLEPDQVVLGAVDRGLGEHPGRLLERRRREEARRVEGGLRHAEQDDLRGRGLAALGQDAVVRLLEVEAVDELGREEVRVARLVDADLAEHLPDDDLDVLVVDRDALAPVDLLDFLDQVALHRVLAARVEVLLRVDRTVGDRVAGADLLAVLDEELRVVGDRVLALDPVLGANGEVVAVPDQDPLLRGDDVGRRRRPCPTRGPGPGPSRRGRRPRRAPPPRPGAGAARRTARRSSP